MQTRVSTKGQIVLPGPLRRRLGIRVGDLIDVSAEAGAGAERIVLTLQRKPRFEAVIVTDAVTGLPVLDLGPGAPVLTNEAIAEILADFP
jgi:AbrB family looped-hinge helix DNA binding protein